MRSIISVGVILLVLSFASLSFAQNDTLKVLFVGNSHTYTNDLPMLFQNLSASGGHPVVRDMSAPGGYTLQQHCTNPTTLAKIAMGTWDYVVLQDHSLYPIIDYYRFGSMYPAVIYLDSLIRSYNQSTALYMTWGRPNGGEWCLSGYCTLNFLNYFEMQDSVSVGCRMIADSIGILLSPAGDSWAVARHWDSTLALWQTDDIHPTLRGSYLAACVFYGTFYHESPVGLLYTAGLSQQDALFLQRAAEQTISGIDDAVPNRPNSFSLSQNYPNPFNMGTTISFSLPHNGSVSLAIYDILGRRIRLLENGRLSAGQHQLIWNGDDDIGKAVPSGLYFAVLKQNEQSNAIKLMMLK